MNTDVNDLMGKFESLDDGEKLHFFIDVSLHMNEFIVKFWEDKGFIPRINRKMEEMIDE